MLKSQFLTHYAPPLLSYRDNFMSAQEALAYGLIDEIVAPHDEKFRNLTMPPPGMAPQLFGELPEGAADYQFGKIVSAD
jgi:enoyl-CoA hydratase/carnithine racemase